MTGKDKLTTDLRLLLAEAAADPGRLGEVLADESVTDLELRQALRHRLPATVAAFVMERTRFGIRQTVLGAVALSPSTEPRVALQALPGLAWRDLVDVAVAAELAPVLRQKAEALLLEGLNAMRLGDLVTLARLGPRRVAGRLLLSTHALIREAGLHNPRLRDGDLCAVLESAEAPREIAGEILKVHRWSGSYQVRRAIIRSRATPHALSLPLITGLNLGDVRELAESESVLPLVSAVARRLLR